MDAVQAIGNSLAVTGGDTGEAVPAVAEAADISRFDAAMTAGSTVDGVPTEAAAAQAADSETIGTAILDTVSSLRKALDTQMQGIADDLGRTGEVSVQDMVSAHFKLMAVTLQIDLTGKIVAKSTQNLDTLLKAQ